MTYPDEDLDNDLEQQDTQTQESHDIRRLREKAKNADKIAAENAQLKRDLALTQSGIDLTSGVGKLFVKAYDGAPTVEAVKASAIEFGVIAPPEPVVSDEERQQLQQIAQVAVANSATSGAPSNTISPNDAAGWSMDESMRFARTHPTEWEALKRGEDVLRP